jgi:putative tryptophan/tyrosine transport system substrate-binding protein
MTRRTIGLLVTLACLFVPLAADTQPPAENVYRIGRLSTSAAPAGPDPLLEAFRQGLRDLGYVEGWNLLIESRYAEGQEDRCPALAAELVRLPVDVLVAAPPRSRPPSRPPARFPLSWPGAPIRWPRGLSPA